MMEMVHQMAAGEIRGLIGMCNNPFVSLPHHSVVRAGYDALEFHAQSDFFLSETAQRADVVLPATAWAEDEGVVTNGEGRVVKYNKAAEPPGEARPDWWIMCELASRLGVADKFPFSSPREVFDELRVASRGGNADYYGITYEKVEATGGVFWPCPDLDDPGPAGVGQQQKAAPSRQGRGDEAPVRPAPRARSRAAASTAPRARRSSTRSSGSRRPSRPTTSTRCGSPPVAPSRTSCRATRRAASRA
jgi:anaerobic selenocysteine-containing dehydrogenase